MNWRLDGGGRVDGGSAGGLPTFSRFVRFEACRRIREQSWGKNMRLVALTGWGQEEDRRRSEEAGFDAHFVKPVTFAALTKLLAGVERRGRTLQRAASAPCFAYLSRSVISLTGYFSGPHSPTSRT